MHQGSHDVKNGVREHEKTEPRDAHPCGPAGTSRYCDADHNGCDQECRHIHPQEQLLRDASTDQAVEPRYEIGCFFGYVHEKHGRREEEDLRRVYRGRFVNRASHRRGLTLLALRRGLLLAVACSAALNLRPMFHQEFCDRPGVVNGGLSRRSPAVEILGAEVSASGDEQCGNLPISVGSRMEGGRAPVAVLVVIVDVSTRVVDYYSGYAAAF